MQKLDHQIIIGKGDTIRVRYSTIFTISISILQGNHACLKLRVHRSTKGLVLVENADECGGPADQKV